MMTLGAKVPVSRRHLSVVPDLPVQLPQRPAQPVPRRLESMDRDEAITKIRAALKDRSDKRWSVRGGTGTAWGWITIIAPPARRGEHGEMTAEDCAELGELFALGHPAHHQGISVGASILYRHEYVARAEGRQPDVLGTPYWD
ncbi:hypothetical protein [Mycolicibacterium peregrinum]|uniref:hypothetical protein n=1 Tax=Mycolicibacterium peregrinum TaxID=43304 RepID=UPI001055DAB8|nr:hypothetical protein [Mycolicibacterium peregrinum]